MGARYLDRDRPRSVSEIADDPPVSRPAVSQHLKVLQQGGLVTYETVGTRNLYRVDPAGLDALRGWLDDFWSVALDSYVELARRESDRKDEQ